jgi:2'-5' RNA ligase
MAYAVISYPEMNEIDYQKIQQYRKLNDEWLFTVVEPHITLVFPVFEMTEKDFIAEIDDLVTDVLKIDFVFRCAIINKDSFSDYYHVLLAPDEGFSQIVKLHDKFYGRNFKPYHRMDIDFIPHMGVGTSKDKEKCKIMVDEWNNENFSISGTISLLSIVRYNNNLIENIKEIRLK